MIIGYIKKERKLKNPFQGIEIRSFDNNYIITIQNEEKNRVKKKLVKHIRKLKIEAIVFSKELEGNFKNEICEMLENNIRIINGKKLMEYMEFDILTYILEKQQVNCKQEDIYIVFKKDSSLDLNFLKIFIENFRMTNIVTNEMERLKNVQDNLLEQDNILIAVSNNKKKALKRAKYILNINLTKEELEKYKIDRDAIIVNIKENVKLDNPSFNGINVNYFTIKVPDEYSEKFEEIGGKFDLVKMYESVLFKENFHKAKIEKIQERISRDGIKVDKIIGNNGEIREEEITKNTQKIHKQNLDKMRKLV